MKWVQSLINNRVLIAGLCAWIAAQLLKGCIAAVINREFRMDRLLGDGGMPSGHSATVTAVATTCGLRFGLDSPVFGADYCISVFFLHLSKTFPTFAVTLSA